MIFYWLFSDIIYTALTAYVSNLCEGDPIIVLEFMLLGDLRSFLRTKRIDERNEAIYVNSKVIDSGLEQDDILNMNLDVARGVEYLKTKAVSVFGVCNNW